MAQISPTGLRFIDTHILRIPSAETRARRAREVEAELEKVRRLLEEYEGTHSATAATDAKVAEARAFVGGNQFDRAMKSAKEAMQEAQALAQEALGRKATRDALVKEVAALPSNPPDATVAEAGGLDALRTTLAGLLSVGFPSAADIAQAQLALQNLRTGLATVRGAVDTRMADTRTLEKAHAEFKTELDQSSSHLMYLQVNQAGNQAALKAEHDRLKILVTNMETVLRNPNPAQITQEVNQIVQVRADLAQLRTNLLAAARPLYLNEVQNLNISNAEKAAVAKLAETDYTAFTSAQNAFLALQQDHAGPNSETERQAIIANLAAARLDRDAKRQDSINNPQDNQKSADAQAAEQLVVDTKKELKAVEAKQAISRAILSNTFSADKEPPFPPDLLKDAFEVIERNPTIGKYMLRALAHTEKHKDVIETAKIACEGYAARFAYGGQQAFSEAQAEYYALSLVRTAGQYPVGPDTIRGFITQRHDQVRKQIPELSWNGYQDDDDVVAKRAKYVAKALLKPGGDLDINAARMAVGDIMLNYEQAGKATPVLIDHMLKTLDFLENEPEAKRLLMNVEAPGIGGGRGLVAKDTGKTRGELTTEDFRQSILGAMLTPIYQGAVGSCFATGPVIKMRQEDPLGTMKHFRDLAVEGVFRPKTGDPVPAVKNIGGNSNKLIRSLEYTVATAASRIDKKGEHVWLEKSIDEVGKLFGEKIKGGTLARLKTALVDAFEMEYDPDITYNVGADGSSSQGKFVLVSKASGKRIESLDDYKNVVKDVIHATIKKGFLPFSTGPNDALKVLDDQRFADKIKMKGRDPWDLVAGGEGITSIEVIDRPVAMSRFHDPNVNPPIGTKELLTSFMANFVPSQDPPDPSEMITIYSPSHLFNAMPGHPSLAPLREGGPANIAANMQRELIVPGQNLAQRQLEEAALLEPFETTILDLMHRATDPADKQAFEQILQNNLPQGNMTPAAFKQHFDQCVQPVLAQRAQREAAQWGAAQVPVALPAQIQTKEAELLAALETTKNAGIDTALLNAVETPQFVIADTNWNSGRDKQYIVIVADPVTGNPRPCIKMVPEGSLRVSGNVENWLNGAWGKMA